MTTPTPVLPAEAVVGRHVEFSYRREPGTWHPGIITALEPGYDGDLLACVRIDGTRYTLRVPTSSPRLRYLEQVTDVPALPMGPFTPTADPRNGIYALDGVLYAAIGEDGEDLVVVTGDLEVAKQVARQHAADAEWDLDETALEGFRPEWAQFVWEPEDAESRWVWTPASKGNEHAVHAYYLPA